MVEGMQKLVLCARRYYDSESHRNEYPEDIVITGCKRSRHWSRCLRRRVQLCDFRAACAALLGFALVHDMH